MCLAIPMQVIAVDGVMATIKAEGLVQRCSLALLPDAAVGDFVLVHAGYAITVLDQDEAGERLQLFAEMEALEDDETRHS